MRVREAKDFLVQQTAEQAALESVPLSDLEKRMMYFTEGKGALEDPATLNEEFEAQYDTATYEKKMSGLMRGAYRRLKRENPEGARQWNRAIRTLSKGDHYILVLCGSSLARGAWGSWRIYLAILVPIAVFWAISFLFFPRRDGSNGPLSRYVPTLTPRVEHVIQVLFLVLLIAAVFFPRFLGRIGSKCLDPIFDWILGPEKDESKE